MILLSNSGLRAKDLLYVAYAFIAWAYPVAVLSVCQEQLRLILVDHAEPLACFPVSCGKHHIRNFDIGVRWVHSSKSFGDGEYFRLAVGDEYSIFIMSRELTVGSQNSPAVL